MKAKEKFKKIIEFLLNPHFLLCFGIAWLITNGWSYIMLGIGTCYEIGWMMAAASAYLAFLWLPVSPEKIATFAIALTLLRWLFPNDQKTLAVLRELLKKTKDAFQSRKKKKTTHKKLGSHSETDGTRRVFMRKVQQPISYSNLFWLFIMGSLSGVLLEGVFCLFSHGYWETHTVAVWGPFCIIYGIGAVVLYIGAVLMKDKNYVLQFFIFAASATVVEYLCGALLKYGLHMQAWDYSRKFLNIDGLVCPTFTVGWGIAGIVFSKWCVPALGGLFSKINTPMWNIACIALSIFMALNLLTTSICIIRWSQRHRGVSPRNSIERYIDETWDDNRMQKRFCEWRFIEKGA
ncbi:MAG: putative ABC transporter permease [Roseburia sp.]|nr:putative ABC transporter permease [Roseburia sp.]